MNATGTGLERVRRLYYLLALFNVITVAASLYLGHELIETVQSSAEANRHWVNRLERYTRLGQMARQVNAPVNQVFADGDVDKHEQRTREALSGLKAALDSERRDVSRLPEGPRSQLAPHFGAIEAAVDSMAADAGTIFASVRAGRHDTASRHMAAMDRRYLEAAEAVYRLRDAAVRLQTSVVDHQERVAAERRWSERVLAAAVFTLVAATALYGRQASRRMQRAEQERVEHTAALEAAQEALRQQAQNLEVRIQERTSQLASANRELSRVAAIVNSIDDAIYSSDGDGVIRTWNPAATAIFGYAPEEIIGKSADILIPEELRGEWRAIRRQLWEQRKPGHFETVRLRKDGTTFPASLTISPVLDERGNVEALGGILRDETEASRQRERLIESERRLAEAQEIASVGSWELDLETNAVTWSAQQFRLLGFPPDSSQPPSHEAAMQAIHPDDRPAIEQQLRTAMATGEPFRGHHRVVWPDGTVRIFHSRARVIRDDRGKPIRVAGTSQDITAVRRAEQALRRSEERFQLVARATNDVLWDWDVRHGGLWWSEGISTLFGRTAPATLDEWSALVHPDDAGWVRRSLQEFLESRRDVWSGEYRFRRGDGSYAWVLDRGIAVRNAAGTPVRMVGSMIDITDRKEAERLKSDFVSFVSHQLRTPLSGMNWMLELAADAEHLPPKAREYIAEARESAARLGTLVNDLLDIARLESGRTALSMEVVPLQQITESVLREMQTVIHDKRHHVTFESQGAPPALADAQMIRQAIANLLSNAIKYTPDGGQIEISVVGRDGVVEWRVKDNGMGIPRAAQARLFEKFYRADNAVITEAQGTGLGLHLVRLIVEQARGHIWVESEEGRGAMFAFTLPAAVPQQGD